MVGVAVQESVVRGRLSRRGRVVRPVLLHRCFVGGIIVFSVARVGFRFFPGIERRGDGRNSAVPHIPVPGSHFYEDIEARASSLLPCGNKVFIENVPAHMLHGIDPEGVDAHVDVFVVGVDQIVVDRRLFRVEIHAIPGDLSGLHRIGLPGEALLGMVDIIVGRFRLHERQSGLVLLIGG